MGKETGINFESKGQEEVKKEIKYNIAHPPYFIQGSFALDKIFGVNTARDIDIFLPEGSEPPEIANEEQKPVQKIELPENSYFPPLLGCYNIDRYLLINDKVVVPEGFPAKPEKLELLVGRGVNMMDVIRGIKISLRYSLPVSAEVQTAWQKALEQEFDPAWMKEMLFDSEEDVLQFIIADLREETGEEERPRVAQKISEILGKEIKV